MSRSLWFAAGAGAGVYAAVRVRRVAESLTVAGLRDRASGLALGARLLRDEVAAGQAEKESELRERLGLVPRGRPALVPSPAPADPALARRPDVPHPGAQPPGATHHDTEEGCT